LVRVTGSVPGLRETETVISTYIRIYSTISREIRLLLESTYSHIYGKHSVLLSTPAVLLSVSSPLLKMKTVKDLLLKFCHCLLSDSASPKLE